MHIFASYILRLQVYRCPHFYHFYAFGSLKFPEAPRNSSIASAPKKSQLSHGHLLRPVLELFALGFSTFRFLLRSILEETDYPRQSDLLPYMVSQHLCKYLSCIFVKSHGTHLIPGSTSTSWPCGCWLLAKYLRSFFTSLYLTCQWAQMSWILEYLWIVGKLAYYSKISGKLKSILPFGSLCVLYICVYAFSHSYEQHLW